MEEQSNLLDSTMENIIECKVLNDSPNAGTHDGSPDAGNQDSSSDAEHQEGSVNTGDSLRCEEEMPDCQTLPSPVAVEQPEEADENEALKMANYAQALKRLGLVEIWTEGQVDTDDSEDSDADDEEAGGVEQPPAEEAGGAEQPPAESEHVSTASKDLFSIVVEETEDMNEDYGGSSVLKTEITKHHYKHSHCLVCEHLPKIYGAWAPKEPQQFMCDYETIPRGLLPPDHDSSDNLNCSFYPLYMKPRHPAISKAFYPPIRKPILVGKRDCEWVDNFTYAVYHMCDIKTNSQYRHMVEEVDMELLGRAAAAEEICDQIGKLLYAPVKSMEGAIAQQKEELMLISFYCFLLELQMAYSFHTKTAYGDQKGTRYGMPIEVHTRANLLALLNKAMHENYSRTHAQDMFKEMRLEQLFKIACYTTETFLFCLKNFACYRLIMLTLLLKKYLGGPETDAFHTLYLLACRGIKEYLFPEEKIVYPDMVNITMWEEIQKAFLAEPTRKPNPRTHIYTLASFRPSELKILLVKMLSLGPHQIIAPEYIYGFKNKFDQEYYYDYTNQSNKECMKKYYRPPVFENLFAAVRRQQLHFEEYYKELKRQPCPIKDEANCEEFKQNQYLSSVLSNKKQEMIYVCYPALSGEHKENACILRSESLDRPQPPADPEETSAQPSASGASPVPLVLTMNGRFLEGIPEENEGATETELRREPQSAPETQAQVFTLPKAIYHTPRLGKEVDPFYRRFLENMDVEHNQREISNPKLQLIVELMTGDKYVQPFNPEERRNSEWMMADAIDRHIEDAVPDLETDKELIDQHLKEAKDLVRSRWRLLTRRELIAVLTETIDYLSKEKELVKERKKIFPLEDEETRNINIFLELYANKYSLLVENVVNMLKLTLPTNLFPRVLWYIYESHKILVDREVIAYVVYLCTHHGIPCARYPIKHPVHFIQDATDELIARREERERKNALRAKLDAEEKERKQKKKDKEEQTARFTRLRAKRTNEAEKDREEQAQEIEEKKKKTV